jgi:ribosomal protein L37AE/L43A
MRDNISKGPNADWKLEDKHYLNKTDPSNNPDIQILTEGDWEDEDKEQREYWCAICKSRLDYLEGTNSIWMCSNCSQMYDTSIQDVPVKDIKESRVKTFPELDHYPTTDEDDVWLPFIEGIDPDQEEEDYDQQGVELVSSSADNRIQHLKVKGDITKALSAQHDFE